MSSQNPDSCASSKQRVMSSTRVAGVFPVTVSRVRKGSTQSAGTRRWRSRQRHHWLSAAVFLALFGLAILAIVGVARRSPWARWVALADGIVISVTCLGLVLGIPIVAAARAPLGRPASPTVS